MNRRIGVCLTAALLAMPTLGSGFDMSRHSVPVDQIVSGGPRKDGIPALHAPRLVDAAGATFLHPSNRVIGVSVGAAARAYPINILNWHEAVNDTLGGEPIVVTYCPLTERVLGLRLGEESRAYPLAQLARVGLVRVGRLPSQDHPLEQRRGFDGRPDKTPSWGAMIGVIAARRAHFRSPAAVAHAEARALRNHGCVCPCLDPHQPKAARRLVGVSRPY